MVKAAELLAGEYTLVVTNVPYLGRGKQDATAEGVLGETLRGWRRRTWPRLSSCGVWNSAAKGGAAALVTPQNWLFLTSYTRLRENLLLKRDSGTSLHGWDRVRSRRSPAKWSSGAARDLCGHDRANGDDGWH